MAAAAAAEPVETGLDVLLADQLALLRGKSIAIVCNHTALTRDGEHIADRLEREDGVTVRALFGPEHGIRGTENAGARVDNAVEESSQVPVYSLYDETRGPASSELAGIDLILYDIQDVGARFYTYISTLGHVMESAAANGVPVIVLDRPNMISGTNPEGPICEPVWFTFVGRYPIPVRYALTVGELAQMIVAEGWIAGAAEVDLTVIPCRGWSRSQFSDDVGMDFAKPSPNIPNVDAALTYPGQCFWEGTNVNEGRGTDTPFLVCGAPYIDADRWLTALEQCGLPGVTFETTAYTPEPNAGSSKPKHSGEECHGLRIAVTDRAAFRPVRTGLAMLFTLVDLHPEDFEIGRRQRHFDRLWGTSAVREALERRQAGGDEQWAEIADRWEAGVRDFWAKAQRHLIYD
jgi:beta-N-acetylhexosaminidase